MKVVFAAMAGVESYNISIDDSATLEPFTPAADGSGTYDMGPLNLAPGAHTVKADAIMADGNTSAFCADVPFVQPEPIPVITVTS